MRSGSRASCRGNTYSWRARNYVQSSVKKAAKRLPGLRLGKETTMSNQPVDLSPLDPSRDARRWQARIDAVVAETLRIRRQRTSLLGAAVRYARPALGIAASLALLSWAMTSNRTERLARNDAVDPTTTILIWASSDQV